MKTEINDETDSFTITRDEWFRMGEALGVWRFWLDLISNGFSDDDRETFVLGPEDTLTGEES